MSDEDWSDWEDDTASTTDTVVEKPAKATKPAKPAKATKAEKKAKAEKAEKAEKPAKAEKPTKPAKATKAEKPAKADKKTSKSVTSNSDAAVLLATDLGDGRLVIRKTLPSGEEQPINKSVFKRLGLAYDFKGMGYSVTSAQLQELTQAGFSVVTQQATETEKPTKPAKATKAEKPAKTEKPVKAEKSTGPSAGGLSAKAAKAAIKATRVGLLKELQTLINDRLAALEADLTA